MTRPVKFYLAPDVHRDLHIQARRKGLTGSAYLEEIVRNALLREQEKDDRRARKAREAVA